jgi:hypothetical protein
MPWFKVTLSVYLEAAGPQEARDRALALLPDAGPDGPLPSAGYPSELTQEQAAWWRHLREVLRQSKADSDAGLVVSDGRYPGVRFTPGAAAALAALEFEEQQPG